MDRARAHEVKGERMKDRLTECVLRQCQRRVHGLQSRHECRLVGDGAARGDHGPRRRGQTPHVALVGGVGGDVDGRLPRKIEPPRDLPVRGGLRKKRRLRPLP